jgi:hypothetical protein
MSQTLFPLDGGVQTIQTTTTEVGRLRVLSQQYITAKGLEEQPTQWVPGGRPIYRRLPAISETYQIDFFNVVPAANTAVQANVEEIGYVYVPFGAGDNSNNSLLVSTSESKQDLLIKSGTIVWRHGNIEVLPTIVNLKVLDVGYGVYDLAYQLIFDNSPIQKLYQVEDFALTGQTLTITSSTDPVIGWRYSALNAFLNRDVRMWSNRDTYFPTYAQPASSFLQWESELAMAYSRIQLRCPSGTSYSGTATLSYYDGTTHSFVKTVDISYDITGQFFEFDVDPRFQTGWKIQFSSLDISVQSITVSGVITQLEKQAEASSRAVLVLYPSGTMPRTVQNSAGETISATYCALATLEIGRIYNVESISDTRYVIHRDYQPVADWLTLPFDEELINLYEQVEDYSNLWLAPPSCLKQEYLALEENQITVEI